MDALPHSKHSLFLHVASLRYYEQFSQFCQYSIPNRIRAKNPRTNLTFVSLINFKGDLTLLEKFDKFPKNPS
jgi:hypothetical protein